MILKWRIWLCIINHLNSILVAEDGTDTLAGLVPQSILNCIGLLLNIHDELMTELRFR